ncbi:hypothetical protein LCGC14_1675890, partial [marine sediment metagenome]
MTLADFVSSLPREEQVRLADKFNEAFSGEDFGCESFANHPLGRTESMSDDLRCSCGFAEKIEAALERIRAAIKGSGHGYEGYIKLDERLLTAYEHVDSDPDHYTSVAAVQFDGLCNLQKAVFGLADKVDPPIQKARGWRVGDELECIEAYGTLAFVPGDRAIIVGIVGKIGAPSGFRILKIGAS